MSRLSKSDVSCRLVSLFPTYMLEFFINPLDKGAALPAVRLRRNLLGPFLDGAGIPQYSQDPNLSDPPISGGLGGLISEPLTSHPIIFVIIIITRFVRALRALPRDP